MSIYQDPQNVDQIITQVKECETHDEVLTLINEIFPNWIIGCPKRFCIDYPHFQYNWEYVSKKSGCKTLNIIIVDEIVFDNPKYSLIRLFCELLTVFGHSVRRKEEFIGCKVCGDAIPSQYIHNQLVERHISTPASWMLKCQKC
jgi:hypothetical protein